VTDRPETVVTGSNVIAGLSKESVTENLRKVMDNPEVRNKMASVQSPYGEGDSSQQILDITEKLHAQGDLLRFEKAVSRKNI